MDYDEKVSSPHTHPHFDGNTEPRPEKLTLVIRPVLKAGDEVSITELEHRWQRA